MAWILWKTVDLTIFCSAVPDSDNKCFAADGSLQQSSLCPHQRAWSLNMDITDDRKEVRGGFLIERIFQ